VTGVLPHRVYYTPTSSSGFVDYLYSLYVYVEPIPLTDEILLAAGCTKQQEDSMFFLEGFGLIDTLPDGSYEWLYNDGLTVPIKYLHHLQNLYFYTKTEELNIEKIFLLLKNK
jgi:hypothetical protein